MISQLKQIYVAIFYTMEYNNDIESLLSSGESLPQSGKF